MGEREEQVDKRAFDCPHCGSTLLIARALPSTTGPCPNCNQLITSPSQEKLKEEPREQKLVRESRSKLKEQAINEVKRSRLLWWGGGFVAILGILSVVLILGSGGQRKGGQRLGEPNSSELSEGEKEAPVWAIGVKDALKEFLKAPTSLEKSRLTLGGERNNEALQQLEEIFGLESEQGLPTIVQPLSLGEKDLERGIYGLLVGGESREEEDWRAMALFVERDGNLLLDWQTYAQTRYRLLGRFLAEPQPGGSGLFRLLVRVHEGRLQVRDPLFKSDTARLVCPDFLLGEELSQPRTATVWLQWNDDATELRVQRWVCWEFLGVGGENGSGEFFQRKRALDF